MSDRLILPGFYSFARTTVLFSSVGLGAQKSIMLGNHEFIFELYKQSN